MTTMTTPATTTTPPGLPVPPLVPPPVRGPEPVPYADRFIVPLTSRPMPPLVHDEPAGYRWAWLAVGLAVTALFAYVVVFRFYAPADSGVDQNAYLVGGRLIAQTGSLKYVLPNAFAYTGGMFVRMPTGVYYPKYPAGLPLLYAAVFKLFGPDRGPVYAFLVSPVSAVAAVLGTFLLARAVAGSFAGVMAAVLLGTSQVMLSLADNPNSHAACTAVIVWGMYLLVRWWTTGSVWQGMLAGLLIGYAYTIRYTEGLLVLPVAIACLTRIRWRHWSPWAMSAALVAFAAAFFLFVQLWTAGDADGLKGWHYWFSPGRSLRSSAMLALYGGATAGVVGLAFAAARGWLPRAWWAAFVRNVVPGLAWCVPVVLLVVYNSATMRHAAGYDTTHESEFGVAFKWSYLAKNWEMVVRTFDDLELFFVVPFAVAGLAMVFRRSWRVGLLLLSWVVPGVLLYTSYYWSMEFDVAYARFYLTFLPALCVAAAVAFHDGLLGGRVGGTGSAAVRGAWRHVSPVVQVMAAAMVVAAVVLVSQAHLRGGWDTGSTAGSGWGHWAGDGRKVAVGGAALLVVGAAGAVVLAAARGGVARGSWGVMFARVPALLAVGLIVATSASVSVYRSLKGMRDGDQMMIPIAENYRTRLNLALVGEHLLGKHVDRQPNGRGELVDNVPAGSILLTGGGGGIASPTNYIQFLRDWDVYPYDTFTTEGSRRGFGGGGGGNRNRNNGRGGGGGGRGFFGGGGGGGRPGGPGGGPGGPGGPGGGGPPGMGGGNNNDDQDTTPTATPVQPEQQEYHASLYRNKRAGELPQLQASLFKAAFDAHRRIFIVVDKEAMDTFQENNTDAYRYTRQKYAIKPIAAWSDVGTPIDRDDETPVKDDGANRWGGRMRGRGGNNNGGMNGMGRLFGISGTQTDWQLAEVVPVGGPAATPARDDRRTSSRRR